VLIGLGTAHRGDDAAGLLVAAALRARVAPGVRVVAGCADAMAFVLALERARLAVVVDALWLPGASTGSLHYVDLDRGVPPAARRRASGHGDALGAGWRLARALGAMPRRVVLVGVAGASFGLGARPSAPVRRALPALAEAALQALEAAPA
jgi:hydrogenase maturation protease